MTLDDLTNDQLAILSQTDPSMREQCESELVIRNRGLVELVVHRAAKADWMVDDLVQEGLIGMVEATRSWNPDSGAKWITWAYGGCRWRVWSAAKYLQRISRKSDPRPAAGSRDQEEIEARLDAEALLQHCSTREKGIVTAVASGRTRAEIAVEQGVCRERIQQIYKRGMNKMRARANARQRRTVPR